MRKNNKKRSDISRREFLALSGKNACLFALAGMGIHSCMDSPLFCESGKEYFLREARMWHSLQGGAVQCDLCPNRCQLGEGERGICRVRSNIGGRLFTLVYSRISAQHVDPVEKKPMYHFLPGATAFSVATAGCNLSCKFCQNWQLSQSMPEDLDSVEIPPDDLSRRARSSGSRIIAYTYNEPTVQYEYILDSSLVARKNGIRPIIISNGFINPDAGRSLAANLDGIKIDLKAFSENFYSRICGGSLNGVLQNLESVYGTGRWLEIVVLVIPTLNDDPGEIGRMASWVRKNLSADVPMHFTRFHAMYKIRNLPPTPVSTLERCRTIAREQGIRYPYVGNVPGHRWENTFCHNCGREIITRSGFYHVVNRIKNRRCPFCGTAIPGVWS